MLYREVCRFNGVMKTRCAPYGSAFICHLAEPATLYNWLEYLAENIKDDEDIGERGSSFTLSINNEQPREYTSRKMQHIQDVLNEQAARRTLLSAEVQAHSTYRCDVVYFPQTGEDKILYRKQFDFKSEESDPDSRRQFTGHIVDREGLKKWLKRIGSRRAYILRVNERIPRYHYLPVRSVKKALRDCAASRDLFSIEWEKEKGKKFEMCSVVYPQNFSESAFATEPVKSLIEDLRLSVLMPAKATARRGNTSIDLMSSGESRRRSVWDWWRLFGKVGIHLDSVLTRLAHEEIGQDWKVEYHTWSSYLHSGCYYSLVKKHSRKRAKA